MPPSSSIAELHALSRSFGPAAARAKLQLLERVARAPRVGARDLRILVDTLGFLRAYPDDRRVLDGARRLSERIRDWVARLPDASATPSLRDRGIPGAVNGESYAYGTLRRLLRHSPEALEIDWDAVDEETALSDVMPLLLSSVENEASEDIPLGWEEWLTRVRPATFTSDLAFVMALLDGAVDSVAERSALLKSCALPVRYSLAAPGSGRCEIDLGVARRHYQKGPIPRERFPLEPLIRAPVPPLRPRPVREAENLIDGAVRALIARNLEIHSLIWGNPRDVFVHDGARGLRVLLVGTLAEQRNPLSGLYFFLVTKNGIPLGYGPASVCLGTCEMGINLFPEFRGGEIRRVYALVMQVLHHLFEVEFFYLTRYGMGEDNEDALRSGAFWFYRKLGFRPSNPVVEALALEEEAIMRQRPGHRSSRRTLRRLADTEAFLDLAGGRLQRFPFGDIGLAVSRFFAAHPERRHGATAERWRRRVWRRLGLESPRNDGERRVLEEWTPLLALMPDLPEWSVRDRRAVVALMRAKAAPSEARAVRLLRRHRRLDGALRAIATGVSGEEPS